jgi:hypothetical protein
MTAASRDIKGAFGGITLDEDFVTVFKTRTEADLRRSLASVAHAYGWDVSEEVVIPGWGRIDIVIETSSTYLVELKIDLTRPAKVRRAFQQADGYGRWWTANRGRAADVFLVGADIDYAAIAGVEGAYPSVGAKSIAEILGFFERGGDAADFSLRRARTAERALAFAELGTIYSQAGVRMRAAQQILAGGDA